MDRTQVSGLPLFVWAERSATIIAFSLARRTRKVRRVAEVYQTRRTDKARRQYVSQIELGLRTSLEQCGLPPAAIQDEVQEFWRAVEHEIGQQV